MNSLPLVPRMSEKAYGESVKYDTYVFIVPLTANEASVAAAVTSQFKVTVQDVRTAVIKGKTKKSYRKGSRPVTGKRADFKKAYVRIKKGDKINIFGEEEKTEKKKLITESEPKQAVKTEVKQKKGFMGALKGTNRQVQNRGGDK